MNPAKPPELHFKSVTYTGLQPGPRLIVTGAVHGNETCGTKAIQRVIDEIESGRIRIARGTVTLRSGHQPPRLREGRTRGRSQLEPQPRPECQSRGFRGPRRQLALSLACAPRSPAGPALHPRQDRALRDARAARQCRRSRALHALAIGARPGRSAGRAALRRGLVGHLRHGRRTARSRGPGQAPSTPTRATGSAPPNTCARSAATRITLECGQHEDPSSPEIAHRAILNTLAFLSLAPGDAPQPASQYEALRLREVVDRAHANDQFSRDWTSFDRFSKGDVIATRHDGRVIAAASDGWILFPDVKALPGNEWFYLAEPIAESENRVQISSRRSLVRIL